jgi:hypothetical protein
MCNGCVIEGTSRLAQYAYSKGVIWIDKESYVVLYSDIFDRAGNLWKVWLNNFSFRNQVIPGGTTYPDEQAFLPSIVMVDVQASHAAGDLPSSRFANEQELVLHQGAVGNVAGYFTVASMINAGH